MVAFQSSHEPFEDFEIDALSCLLVIVNNKQAGQRISASLRNPLYVAWKCSCAV